MESGGGDLIMEGSQLSPDDHGVLLLQTVHGSEKCSHHSH